MVNRDAYLSLFAFKSFETKGAVWSLINATLHADINRWPSESRLLASLALSWLTSCSDRRVRDLSGKALTRLISEYPDLAVELVSEFSDCDDDYILESISLAIYSACLLARNQREEFIPALDALLTNPAFDTPNVLIRDSVRLLGYVLKEMKLPVELVANLAEYPSKQELPNRWPTLVEAKQLLDLKELPLNMNLLEHAMAPDFWKYQVEPKIRNFNLESAGINPVNLACWIMFETLSLGYPGRADLALHADREISLEFGTGRGRDKYAERLGKKYYWLLLHRLIGMLADNFDLEIPHSDWKPGPNHLWSLEVRKSDLTDVRDISTELKYPDDVLNGPSYDFVNRTEVDDEAWVRTNDFTPSEQCLIRTAQSGEEWVALTLDASEDDRSPGRDTWHNPYRRVGVSVDSMLIPSDVRDEDIDKLNNNEWYENRKSFCDGYIAEYPDSPAFHQMSDERGYSNLLNGVEVTESVVCRDGEWEYDFSFWTKDRQESLRVPNQDLINVLALNWDRQRGWIDSNGKLIAFDASVKNRRGLFMLRSAVNKYLELRNRQLVHLWFANRVYFASHSFDSPQLDLSSVLLYRRQHAPAVLKGESQLFHCEDGPKIQGDETNFPFSTDESSKE